MTEEMREKLRHLPESPGIYKMLDAERRIIYIGKSKCLRKRVNSYFVPEPKWEKARKMAPLIKDIEYIVTDTHLEAMLLECRAIKQIQPYFNVMMKNDERYVYLELGSGGRKNPLSVSTTKSENSFGPVRSRRRLEELIEGMKNLYPLEKKKDGGYAFSYHLFPIRMGEEEFQKNYKILHEICTEPSLMKCFLQTVEEHMRDAAKQQKYERAVKYRELADRLRYLDRGLNDYRELTSRDFIYTVALEQGFKIFYICDGLMICSRKAAKIGKRQKISLEKEAARRKPEVEKMLSDKEKVDYRAIIWMEISEAAEDTITYPDF